MMFEKIMNDVGMKTENYVKNDKSAGRDTHV